MENLTVGQLTEFVLYAAGVIGAAVYIRQQMIKWFAHRVLHTLKEIETQLKPNGGNSVLDYSKSAALSAGRVEDRLAEIQEKLEELDNRDASSSHVQYELMQRVEERLDNHLMGHERPEKNDEYVRQGKRDSQ